MGPTPAHPLSKAGLIYNSNKTLSCLDWKLMRREILALGLSVSVSMLMLSSCSRDDGNNAQEINSLRK